MSRIVYNNAATCIAYNTSNFKIKCALQTSTFPINCAECNTPVSCMDIKILCGRYQLDIEVQKMNSASLNIFIRAHKQYRHCPNYNCKGFIDTTIKYRCILCHTKICSDCLDVFHEPKTCEEYVDNIKQVDHWINEQPDDRKRCPHCAIGIERTTSCYNVLFIYLLRFAKYTVYITLFNDKKT